MLPEIDVPSPNQNHNNTFPIPFHQHAQAEQRKRSFKKSSCTLSASREGRHRKERRYRHAEKDGLGDAMGVSKHGEKTRHERGMRMQPDQMRQVKQRRGINPIRVFLGFSFLSERDDERVA
jgi:hypothetical protein